MAAWQMEHSPSDDGSIFNAFTFDNLNNRMFVQKGYRSITRKAFVKTLDILIDAGLRGVISDWPRFYRCADKSAGSPSIERSRLGEQAHSMEQPALNKSNRNFSDTFVTEFVERARWLQDNLADQIIDCWKKDQAIRRKFAKAGKAGKDHDVVVARRKCIQKYDWRDCSGRPLTQLTFLQYSTDHQDPSTAMSWPPDSARGLREMISTLQGFNLGIVALCTGARSSELLAAEDMPLGLQDGRYASTTFKMVDETGGKLRDWPLHAIAVRALHIQHQIAALFRPKRSKALWVPVFEDRVQDVHHGTKQFARAVNLLGLGKHLDDRNAHLHRWRHTVARLIALAVVSAPQVLLDLFGHRDFGMTLQYILSAPRIAEEAIRIAREETYVMAENAITETLMGETSGGASEKLRVNLPKAMRHGKDLFDTSSLRETAEVLTFRGAHFNLVRPGVICTKGRGEFGPCTAGRGAPDPGACRTSCDKRLELAISKKQCEETLLFLRLERLSAVSEGLEMLVENINGQMVSELRRWDDVRKRLTATYNDIRTLWDEEQRCPAKF
ncbi:hypothetical protein [Tardiphaga sp. OK246]|jgi:hypothetical protein|uniref:hypothetical protein n=1 Tax=Tardiphaga sp. OK246 TaxID=1855307 RepID=UPI000B7924C8|nr:hypothetical protein [Tardiphaga sp. OK246]